MAAISPTNFWKTVRSRATGDTLKALFGEHHGSRVMIAALLFCVYIFLLWKFGSGELAGSEIALKIAGTLAPLLLFPFIWVWRFFGNMKTTYRDCYDAYVTVKNDLEERPKFEILILQDGIETLCQVTNVGSGQASLNVDIDFSEANLQECPRGHVGANWKDGYAGGYRVFYEGTRNVFLLRTVEHSFERFYGGVGGRPELWDSKRTNSSAPMRRRITLLANARPRAAGGLNKIILETLGKELFLISGDAKIHISSG